MTDAEKPKNDREFLLKLSGQLDRLSDSITRLESTLKYLEDEKIASIEKRLNAVQKWQTEVNGSWRLVVVIGAVLSILAIVFSFFK